MFFISCGRTGSDISIIPPPTNPLARDIIGCGVVEVSFAHVQAEPGSNDSLGYLRRRSVVRIIERGSVNNNGNMESWVKIDSPYSGAPDGKIQGWLRESSLIIYDNEDQAQTAARAMTP